MSKIPVVATAVAAYRYVFANYLRLLGIFWATAVLMFALLLGVFMPRLMEMEQGLLHNDPSAALAAMGPILLFELVVFLLMLVPVIGVTRQVLGRPTGWPFFYFALDGDYWRLVLSSVVAGLIMFGILFAVIIPVSIVMGLVAASTAGPHPDPNVMAAHIRAYQPLILAVVYPAMLFAIVRFGFFLPSIAIAEKRLGIGRNWALTRGNSWRITGVILLILIPLAALVALQLVVVALLGGPNYLQVLGPPQTSLAVSRDMMQLYVSHWYIYVPVALLLYPLGYGPILVASAHAYRAVAGEVPPAQN